MYMYMYVCMRVYAHSLNLRQHRLHTDVAQRKLTTHLLLQRIHLALSYQILLYIYMYILDYVMVYM